MSKYKPLTDRLSGHSGDEWRASFSDLEEVLGFPLPKGARTGRTWWANEGDKSHHKAWSSAGWRTADIDPATGYVTFRRAEASGFTEPAAETVVEPDAVQPEAMRRASEKAARSGVWRDAAPAALVAGVAVAAGIAAMVARKAFRRSAQT